MIDRVEEQERRLAKQARELEAVHAEVSGLLYSICHDLGSPLHTISGFSEALDEEYGDGIDPEGRNFLGRVRASSRRMEEMIADLHRLAQVSRSELRRQNVNLSEIAEAIAESLRQSDPQRDVAFSIEPGLTMQGDPGLMRIVLENLLQNAWKFTRTHPAATIAVGSEAGENSPIFYVRDDGVGFDPKYAARLFLPFQRLHPRAEFEGNGIGLAIVQRILHRHGGRVTAAGSVDEGATVFIVLE